MDKLGDYSSDAIELSMIYAPKVLLAIITLVIGLWIIGSVVKVTRKGLEKSKTDETLVPFFTSLISWTLKAILLISVASMVGIATTSFVAILGAAGLAIGLALQGSLGNFAGGVLILIFKPYTVGDLVEAQGHLGVVKEVQIFNTILLTPSNKRVIIPNGAMSNGSIVNYSAEGQLRVDLVIGIAYESDVPKAKSLLLNMMMEDARVLKEPAPVVAVSELADSSVNLVVRPWCGFDDYWDVYFDTTEKAKRVLEENGISIPFPQHDVHIQNALS
ncbi:putative small-conductance mechanosensitive channel [delta proteobacterium NaphS2]|nr:putative small-conductance mechanosensitive channel [delta proteobacterium NaphS2]